MLLALAALATFNLQPSTASAQSTVFTYQGRVLDNGTNFNGPGEFKFALVTSTNFNSTAAATANAPSGGFITIIDVTFGGNGYTGAPTVTISGGGGSGAAATAIVTGGVVTGVAINNPGSGYTSTPTVTIAPPPAHISYTSYWSNDGTSAAGSEPAAAMSVNVADGLFTVVLGDPTVANMKALSVSVFAQPNLQLRIWFNDGVSGWAVLSPAQNLTPTPYSIIANSASNLLGTLPAAQLGGAVGSAQIAARAVGSAQIANRAVGNAQLAANSVTSGNIVDGTITDADISATAKIAMSKIVGGPGINFGSFPDLVYLPTTLTGLGSITLTCPTSGQVLVMLTGDGIFFGDGTVIEFGVGTTLSAFAGFIRSGRLDGSGTSRYYNSFSVNRVFTVSAGSHTFYGLAQKESVFSANNVNLTELYMVAIFIPNVY